MRGLLLFTALMIAPLQAAAADYRVVNEDRSSLVLADTASLDTTHADKTVQLTTILAEPDSPGGPQILSYATAISCTDNRSRMQLTGAMTIDLKPSAQTPSAPEWRDIDRDSPLDTVAAYACNSAKLAKADAADLKTIAQNYLKRRAVAAPAPSR